MGEACGQHAAGGPSTHGGEGSRSGGSWAHTADRGGDVSDRLICPHLATGPLDAPWRRTLVPSPQAMETRHVTAASSAIVPYPHPGPPPGARRPTAARGSVGWDARVAGQV